MHQKTFLKAEKIVSEFYRKIAMFQADKQIFMHLCEETLKTSCFFLKEAIKQLFQKRGIWTFCYIFTQDCNQMS